MTPADGAFDTSIESIRSTIGASDLAAGEHVVWLRARDLAGNWGPTTPAVFTIAPADLVFADGFENGGLSAWSTITGAGQLSVSTAAAIAGRNGLTVTLNGSTAAYLSDNSPAAEASYHARFLLDPRTLATQGGTIGLFAARSASGATVLRIQYQRTTAGASRLRATISRQGGSTNTAWFTITDLAHPVEIAWQSAPSARVTLWIDGLAKQTLTGLNTSTYKIDSVRLGPSSGLGSGMTGSAAIDGFVSTRTSAVGP
jgi:hypothetical protein